MDHLNDHDLANTRAIIRSILGLTHKTGRLHTGHYPHPNGGGTRDQPLWLRTMAMNYLATSGSYCRAAHRVL